MIIKKLKKITKKYKYASIENYKIILNDLNSCNKITKDIFRTAVFSAAAQSGRTVRILHQLTQPADHPVNLFHPETEYLKGLVLYVE